MSSTAFASVVFATALVGCLDSGRWTRLRPRGAISSAAAIPVAATAAGSAVSRRLRSPAKMPVASPTPTTVSASASMAVLRKLRLNSRSAISLVGIPSRCRIHAPTPTPPHAPPGSFLSPPPSCAQATLIVRSVPSAVTIERVLRVDDRAPGDDEPEFGQQLERDRPEHPLPGDMFETAQRLLQRGNQLQHQVGHHQVSNELEGCSPQMTLGVAERTPRRAAPARTRPAGAGTEPVHDQAASAGRPTLALLGSSSSSTSADHAKPSAPIPRPSLGS